MQQTKYLRDSAAVAPVETASPSMLESLLVLLTVALALWIFLVTVNVARTGWVAIPTVDDWDRWITYVRDHYSPWWFFQQHVDHRLAAPKVLFAIDHLVFHGRGWFLLVCSFFLQALTGIMLWKLAGRAYPQGRMERVMQAAVIASCIFSAQQWKNFVWPFQVQFPMVYCAAAAALFALVEWSGEKPGGRHDTRWTAAAIALATVATYSMANGVLVWPVLLLAAVWLRMPRRWIGAMAAAALLFGATYFYHWHKANPYPPLPPSQRLPRALIFGLAHLGSPTAPLALLRNSLSFNLAFAAIPGALLALALAIGFVMLWRRREHYNSAQAVLLFYCVFIACGTVTMAYGRSEGDLLEAFSPRYLTPSYILWAGMLLLLWPRLRRVNHVAFYGALCAAVCVGIAIHQRAVLHTVRDWVASARLGEAAVVDNVTDPDPWRTLFHTPQITMDAIDYLKNNNLTVFTEEWTHWPGIPLSLRFSIDRNTDDCQGHVEQAMAVPSSLKPGWRITGWAWDNKAARAPGYIILADDSGQVAGVALTGFPLPPAFSALSAQYASTAWNGYVNGQPRTITAYVLEANSRSLCAIGTQKLQYMGVEVAFKALGDLLPVSAPEIAGGAFTPNGYYKGLGSPGNPPVDGPVFGSFPDTNKGSIRFGPFHLDGHTEMAIPVVTGPDSHNLTIGVRDAVSKEVLVQMDPPPVHETWWAWRPGLPLGREMTVEVFAEDQGSNWGQWMAIAWPHVLR